MTAYLGYLSLLSGNVGYTYGASLWDAKDADLPAWKALRGATYQTLYPLPAGSDLLQDLGFQAFTLGGVDIIQPTKQP